MTDALSMKGTHNVDGRQNQLPNVGCDEECVVSHDTPTLFSLLPYPICKRASLIEKRADVAEKAYSWNPEARAFIAADDDTEVSHHEDRHLKRPDLFLGGPVPWWWIIHAAELPGKALVVGLCLWRLRGATKKKTIPLSNTELKPFRVDRAAKSRALVTLERAGLISVQRHRGRWPLVTLITRSAFTATAEK
jgi:hypothetical protein